MREGALQPLGMPNFGDRLSEKEATLIKDYIVGSAQKVRERKIRESAN